MPRYTGLPKNKYPLENNKFALSSAKPINTNMFNGSLNTYYQVKEHDTVESIAFEYYGKSDLYYIIMYANGLSLPTDLYPGLVLSIPLDHQSIIQGIVALNQKG